jgi:hypothetical protein
MTDDITEMSDDLIARLIQRYRDELDALDWARDVESRENYQRFLRSRIRRLVGERERRKHEGDEG